MALDNAEFISELSIIDPPGTDPLNQGDDHIRTTKKAVQQSFPNVNAPVPQTAAQMGQMAIKNEANTFTQINTFSQNTIFNDVVRSGFGTVAAPSYSFTADIGTGMFQSVAGLLNFSVQGTDLFNLQASRATFNTLVRGQDGSAATPAYSFVGETNTGMYQAGVQNLGFATVGVQRLVVSSAQVGATVPFFATNGSPAGPSYTFSSDLTTGMYRDTSSRISFASAGVFKMLIDSTHVEAVVPFVAPLGSAAVAGFSFAADPDTGLFSSVPNTIQFTTGGVQRGFMDGSGITSNTGFRAAVLGAASPSYSFAGRIQSGMYSLSDTAIAFSVQGSTRVIFSTTDQSFSGPLRAVDGTAAAPAYAFTNFPTTGLFVGANAVDVSVLGAQIFAMSSAGLFASAGIAFAGDGGLLAPVAAFNFGNDSDTGMFRLAANVLGFSAGALTDFTMSLEGRNVTTTLKLNQTAGTGATFQTLRDNVLRWAFGGTSADQDFWTVTRFNDAGGFLDNPFQIDRANGQIILSGIPTSNPGGSNILWKNGNVVNIT